MAPQPGGMTGPFYHEDTKTHYWYDPVHDRIIFQDGRQMQRPESIPRSRLLPPPMRYQYTEPPGDSDAYELTTSINNLSIGPSAAAANRPAQGYTAAGAATASNNARTTNQTRTSEITSPDGNVTQTTDVPGGKIVNVINPRSQVRTKFQTGPAEKITDPTLLRDSRGRGAFRMLVNTEGGGNTERLFSTFEVQKSPKKFFTIGTVFMVLWSEPAGQTLVTMGVSVRPPGTTQGRYGEPVHSKVRRFVVIREGGTYCSALPIATYGTKGVGKSGVTKSEHAIIYSGRHPPEPMADEAPARGELGMRPDPIRVDPYDKEDKLDPRSRIDFGKVHTIQHNIKVKAYGQVNDRSMQALQTQFNNCFLAPSVPTAATAGNAQPAQTGNSASGGSQGGHYGGGGGERESIARQQELERQKYWIAVDQIMKQHKCTREAAVEALRLRLEKRREAAGGAEEASDDDDDDDDDDED